MLPFFNIVHHNAYGRVNMHYILIHWWKEGSSYTTQITIHLHIYFCSPRSGVLRVQKLRTPLMGAKGYQRFHLFKPGVGI